MMRKVVALTVAGLMQSLVASASELPIAELASAPFVSALARRPPLAAARAEAPTLRLAWLDPADVASGTELVVRSEVARLLRGMGIEATWRRAASHEVARPGELRVIFLSTTAHRDPGATVLGATPKSVQGEPLVWVHVPSVRAAAGIGGRGNAPTLEIYSRRRLGLALARVIAHEVVHVIAPSLPHGSGLMSARLDRRMLTDTTIRVDSRLGFAVRAALVPAAPQLPPVASVSVAGDDILAVESAYQESYR